MKQKLIKKPKKTWHAISTNHRTFSASLLVKEGKTLSVCGPPIQLCYWGLHSCPKLLDILYYTSYNFVLTYVEIKNYLPQEKDENKIVAKNRRCLKIFTKIETKNIFRSVSNLIIINKNKLSKIHKNTIYKCTNFELFFEEHFYKWDCARDNFKMLYILIRYLSLTSSARNTKSKYRLQLIQDIYQVAENTALSYLNN